MNTIVLIIVVSIVVAAISIYAYKSYTRNAQNTPTPSLPLLSLSSSSSTSLSPSSSSSFPSPSSSPSSFPTFSPTPSPQIITPTPIPTTPSPTLPTVLSTKQDISTFARDDLTGYWLLHIGDNFNNLTDNQDVVVLYQKFKNPNDIHDQNAWPNYWKVTQQMNGTPEKQFPALKEDSTNSSVMISYPNGSNKLLLWSGDGDANDGYTYLSIGSDAVYLKRVYLENGKWKPYFVPKTTPAPVVGDFSKKDISSFKKDDLSGYWLLHIVDNIHNFKDNQDIILQYKKTPNPLGLTDAEIWSNYWDPVKNGNPEKIPSMKATDTGHMAMHFFTDNSDMMMYWGGNKDEYTYINGGFDGAQYNIVLKRVYFDKDMDKWIPYFSPPVITPIPTKAFSPVKQETPFSEKDLTGYWLLHIADNSHNLKDNQDAIFLYQKMNNPLGQLDKQFWPHYWGAVQQMSGEQENLDMVPSLKQNDGGFTSIHFFNNAGDNGLYWGNDKYTHLNFGVYGGDVVYLRRVYFDNGVWKTY